MLEAIITGASAGPSQVGSRKQSVVSAISAKQVPSLGGHERSPGKTGMDIEDSAE